MAIQVRCVCATERTDLACDSGLKAPLRPAPQRQPVHVGPAPIVSRSWLLAGSPGSSRRPLWRGEGGDGVVEAPLARYVPLADPTGGALLRTHRVDAVHEPLAPVRNLQFEIT